MLDHRKQTDRLGKSKALRELVRNLKAWDIRLTSAAAIQECLREAHANENMATSSELSRQELFREDQQAELPAEFSDEVLSQYYANAAGFYEGAALDHVSRSDLPRAFKYYHKAAAAYGKAARLASANPSPLVAKVSDCKTKLALVRYALAKKNLRRRTLSLGCLGRLR
jgi:tetratricopeptide (TPR) repeat protein